MTTFILCLFQDRTPQGNNTLVNSTTEDMSSEAVSEATADIDCSVTGASVMVCIYGVIISVTFIGLMAPGA